jgi:hypothetical protein
MDQVFETPVTNGIYRDVIGGDTAMPASPEVQADEEVQQEDYDEIEYIAPVTIGASAFYYCVTFYCTNVWLRAGIHTTLRYVRLQAH